MSRKAASMQGFADNFIPIIPVEDDPLHAPTNPFCLFVTCPCHEDQENIFHVAQWVAIGLMTQEEATDFVSGKTL